MFVGAPKSQLTRRLDLLRVAGNGDCLFACLVCAAFMASIRVGNGLDKSEVLKLRAYSIFGARVLKRMFEDEETTIVESAGANR